MKRINIAVIGHLDHGKSTLVGRLLFDTKNVPIDRIKEIKRMRKKNEEIDYSLLLDTFQEEREGQFTLDTTQRILKLNRIEYNFIDCPGHLEFIKNMLTGASQALYAVLVVSAKKNEGIERQTKIHINLAKLLGIKKLLIAVNKMDAVNYDKQRFLELKREIRGYFEKINCFKKSLFIPVSAKDGKNTVKKAGSIAWYKGNSLLSELRGSIEKEFVREKESLRFLVQNIYQDKNKSFLLGRIEKGKLNINDAIFFNLSGQRGRVKEIISNEKGRRYSDKGDCVAILVEKIDCEKVKRGEVVSGVRSMPIVKKRFQADVFFLKDKYINKTEFVLVCGFKEVDCKIRVDNVEEYIYKTKILLNEPLVVESVLKTPSLGRFMLLDKKRNIAGLGIINV